MDQALSPSAPSDRFLRAQLHDRRRRLSALTSSPGAREARALLREVDAALHRLDHGSFGLCEACHDPIEDDRLLVDPLVRVCLGCLSAEQTRALERDLELAGTIQAALLPAPDLHSGGWDLHYRYRPHGPVSGDYCDVWVPEGDDGTLHFLIGDVVGKGVAASILMANLQAIFRSLVLPDLPLDEVLGRANRLFSQSTLPNSFATLVAGRLESTGRVEISNAGHCQPLIAQAGKAVKIEASGLPLGVLCEARYEVERFDLGPNDRLLLYTDGLSEARSPEGTTFDVGRIEQVLIGCDGSSAEQLVSRCLSDLEHFLMGAPIEDDMTVMAICREPGRVKPGS